MDIYEDLISSVKNDFELKVSDLAVGVRWTTVKTKKIGISITFDNYKHATGIEDAGNFNGKKAKELLEYLRTFDTLKIGIGLATLNSLIKTPEKYENINIFDYLVEKGKDKKILFIGHFEDIKKLEGIAKKLIILERKPREEDLLDTFQEYLIPESDIVAVTGSTFANKSIKRILELAKGKFTIVFGPSTPLSEVLFDYGVDMIGGMITDDDDKVFKIISQGGSLRNFKNYVNFITLKRRDL
ncbi:MAG: Rossmann-like domain-containing protein [Caldisericia bacterium]